VLSFVFNDLVSKIIWGYPVASGSIGGLKPIPPTSDTPKMALTDTAIRAAKPRYRLYKLADSGGLYLAVSPTGGRLWRLKYRLGGREKILSIGAYPAVSLALAREKRE
jgi:hypothetical protein